MLPKLRLVTFSCLKNARNRVGILQDNKSVIDLSTASQKPAFMDMLKFIDGGNSIVKEAKDIAKNPPANSVIDEKDVVLKAPIPLPRLSNTQAVVTKFV